MPSKMAAHKAKGPIRLPESEYPVKSTGDDEGGDKLIPLWSDDRSKTDAAALLSQFGLKVSKTSLHRWASEGMPVRRGGPRVILPTTTWGNQTWTCERSIRAWLARTDDEARTSG